MTKNTKITVIIVDDHAVVRVGLASLIKDDDSLLLIAEASCGDEGLEKILKFKPDVAVIDIGLGLGKMNGLDLSKIIKEKCPETEILILTGVPDEELVIKAMNIKVSGYFLKEEPHNLIVAIK